MPYPSGVPERTRGAAPTSRAHPHARRHALTAVAVFLLALALSALWEVAAWHRWLDPFFWSKPSAILFQLGSWWREGTPHGTLLAQAGVTLGEAALGLALGSAVGSLLGAACARQALANDVLRVVLAALTFPLRIALGAALALGLGLGVGSKIVFAATLVALVAAGDALAGRHALTSLRVRFALALAGAVVGEVFMAQRGLGLLIDESIHHFNANGVYAALIVLGIVALVGDLLLAHLERRHAQREAARTSD